MTQRLYNLKELYGKETELQRYIRLTVGDHAGLMSLLVHELVLGSCIYIPGLLGLGLRSLIYPLFFSGICKKAYIARSVTLRCPKQIHLASDVMIDENVQLIATSRCPRAIRIGRKSFLRSFVMVNAGPPEGFVSIGKHCSIGQSTILYGNGGLNIGNNVMISGQCFIVASAHNHTTGDIPYSEQGYSAKGITIDNNVWIGAGAKILDGVTIGQGAIVGANSVVTRDIPNNTIVAGIPARPLKRTSKRQI